MRKSTKLMAGLGVVAGLGVALAPLATFADAMGTDSLTVNVNSDCALATAGEPAAQVVIDGEWEGTGTPGQLVTLTGKAGATNVSTVSFNCSVNSKVAISATAEDLSNGSDTIAADQISATYTGDGGMSIVAAYSGQYGALATTATPVANGTAAAATGMTFTVGGYKAQLKADQEPGEYTGDVTYTWALVND